MPETKLTAAEADVVHMLLAALVIRSRTGEVGIVHGSDRFVGTSLMLRTPARAALDSVARQVGLPEMRTQKD